MIKGEVKTKVLMYCEIPRSFIEIHREAGIAQSSLAKFLNDLKTEGLITKTPDGKYILTDKGKEVQLKAKIIEIEKSTKKERLRERLLDLFSDLSSKGKRNSLELENLRSKINEMAKPLKETYRISKACGKDKILPLALDSIMQLMRMARSVGLYRLVEEMGSDLDRPMELCDMETLHKTVEDLQKKTEAIIRSSSGAERDAFNLLYELKISKIAEMAAKEGVNQAKLGYISEV